LASTDSLTGQYLSGRKQVPIPERRGVRPITPAGRLPTRASSTSLMLNEAPVPFGDGLPRDPGAGQPRPNTKAASGQVLRISQATRNNLQELEVELPLHRLVCITGVSGSGKTTLVREVLLPALTARLNCEQADSKASDRSDVETDAEGDPESTASSAVVEGAELLDRVVLVDQSILAKTPRSNPAVYIGAFDEIRELFAQSEVARQRGLNASAFSFNSAQGQCERCRGAGFEKIEMQFLSDVFIRCPDCDGRRYRNHILEIAIGPSALQVPGAKLHGAKPQHVRPEKSDDRTKSIGDILESTVDEAIVFLQGFTESRPAQRAAQSLQLLQEVGLGYLKLGQPLNTLSGGESQRLKLVRHLAEAASEARENTSTLFLFDEPTTGLHFDDVRVLLRAFQRLVDAGHSLVVIEHNLDLIKAADWLIDLGPEAGDGGGRLVAQGTPEEVAACPESHTGRALAEVLTATVATAGRPQGTSPQKSRRRVTI
ncbi:MAG TPA: hypothetical protein VHI52_00695, partial [Verrucomicrobiae bacterium]|nr:hypothetical protein [Verrucomicrobiae bacterium]